MRRQDRDVTALTVLALLLIGPRHTYDMHLMIERTHKDFVTGLPRSIYHAVDRLLAGGLVEVAATTRDGGRPERTVYELTDEGRARLRKWVRTLLSEPDESSSLFVAALTFAGCLPPEEVAGALRDRRAELDRRLGAARDALASIAPDLPRILLVEVEFEAHRLHAEADFVSDLIDDIEGGRLTWPSDPAGVADIDRLLGTTTDEEVQR